MYSRNEECSSKVFCSTTQEDGNVTTFEIKQCGRRRNYNNCFYKMGAKVPARLVLYFLSWSGFLVSFMMRNDINFALVAMTETSNTILINENHTAIHSMNHSDTLSVVNKYDWGSTVKSLIVSSFYWCYVLSQFAGGVATQYFGTKSVFGLSQLATALSSLLIPTAADLHYSAVVALRSLQGFASGLTWPAMYGIVGYWIPLPERSRFMSSFQGFSIGIGLTYPLCGFVIDQFGWRYIFYTTGSLGVAWCILWYFLAFNTPREHPRITEKELNYIEVNVNAEIKTSLGKKAPWRNIFLCMPVWAIGITTFGRIWIHYIFIVSGPNFMKNILGFNYQANGFLSGMPFICSYISSVFFCYIADKLINQRMLTLTNVRKIFTALSQVVPGVLIYWIGYIEDVVLLLVVWFIAVSFITASYAGAMANIVDIAPNFAGPVLAFCQTIHMLASFISPLVAGVIVTKESTIEQWQTVFGVASLVTLLTYVVYQIYATAEIQDWNYMHKSNDCAEEENQILKTERKDTIPKDKD